MKAILVIDVPITKDNKHICNYCPIWNEERNGCQYIYRMVEDKCPLRPMPEPKPIKQEIMGEDYYIGFYGQGWNDCLKELVK